MLTEAVIIDLPRSISELLVYLEKYGLDTVDLGGDIIGNLISIYCNRYTERETFIADSITYIDENYEMLTAFRVNKRLVDSEPRIELEYLLTKIFDDMACFINRIEVNMECGIQSNYVTCITNEIAVFENI